MDGDAHGKPVPEFSEDKGVVPFIKIDKGLDDEANGVQLMKPMPELDALLAARSAEGHFRHQGALGHPSRQSRRALPSRRASSSRSQARCSRHGLVPIIEPEVNIKSAERGAADESCSTS